MGSRLLRRPVRWLLAVALLALGATIGALLGIDVRDPVQVPAISSDYGDLGGRVGERGGPDAAEPERAAAAEPDEEPGSESADDRAQPQPIGEPERIEIPAIGVDAEIVPAGLRDDGAMDVPDFGLAGWYTEGPRPGEEGPATVVAHVDSRAGPDVFARLRELEPGDEVHVRGEDGTVTFVVETSESAPKDHLPVDRIWGWTDEPTLRLLTCDGLFDRSVGHYEDNLIVYLSLRAS